MTKRRLAAFVLCAIAGAFAIHLAVKKSDEGIAGHIMPAKDPPSALVRSLRPNFPYSVIAGGAYSGPELTYANSKDPVVRAHYADFRVAQAKLVQLTDDRYQYASYRVKNQVYWTKKKLRIPKGELLWSDGVSFARARCGNRLSSKPNLPTSAVDPPEAQLSLPSVRPDMLAKLELVEPPALAGVPTDSKPNPTIASSAASPAIPIPAPIGTTWGQGPVAFPASPVVVPPGGGSVPPLTTTTPPVSVPPTTPGTPSTPITSPPPPPTPAPVPEPGSALYLFFFALGASLWAIWKFSPKQEPEEPDVEND